MRLFIRLYKYGAFIHHFSASIILPKQMVATRFAGNPCGRIFIFQTIQFPSAKNNVAPGIDEEL